MNLNLMNLLSALFRHYSDSISITVCLQEIREVKFSYQYRLCCTFVHTEYPHVDNLLCNLMIWDLFCV